MKAVWRNTIIAESDDTVVVEGNHYFPAEALDWQLLKKSDTSSHCPWKGTAHYYSIVVDGETNTDAAWCYAEPEEAASRIRGRIAFWKGVQVTG